jgi:hypothetical protein
MLVCRSTWYTLLQVGMVVVQLQTQIQVVVAFQPSKTVIEAVATFKPLLGSARMVHHPARLGCRAGLG